MDFDCIRSLDFDKIQYVRNLFKKAEKKIKEVELYSSEANIPAINELRYVAYHLLAYLESKDDDDIKKAENHCKRSIYDACEATIVVLLEEIRQFKEDYRRVAVTPVIKEYTQHLKRAKDANQFIQANTSEHDSREDFYEKSDEHVAALKEIVDLFSSSREELNKQLSEKRENLTRWLIGTILLGLTALVARIFIH
ncbi:MAG: hypothetical protein ACYC2R_06195 [Burkholderiales bacterium]